MGDLTNILNHRILNCFSAVDVHKLTTCPYVYEKYVPLPFDFE